jgi:putative intracellular protease/amidase
MAPVLDLDAKKRAAAEAESRRDYVTARALYVELARHESTAAWLLAAGRAAHQADLDNEAVAHLWESAQRFADGGFRSRALEVANLLLRIAPDHDAARALADELLRRLVAVRASRWKLRFP